MALELLKLVAIFVVGGIVGAGLAGYVMQQNLNVATSSSSNYTTFTTTVSQIYVSQVVQVSTTTVTTSASNYYQLANALNDSASAKLNATSYIFLNSQVQQDLLIVQIQNIGSTSMVVTPHDCFLNNTFYAQTKVGPGSQSVLYGQFVYVAPGWSFAVSVKLPFTPSIGDKSTLTIYDNSWSFAFGTARS
ncbi:MAG: hypothetical protein ACYC7D_03105 [Nitrososphaerales archaeon]